MLIASAGGDSLDPGAGPGDVVDYTHFNTGVAFDAEGNVADVSPENDPLIQDLVTIFAGMVFKLTNFADQLKGQVIAPAFTIDAEGGSDESSLIFEAPDGQNFPQWVVDMGSGNDTLVF